MFFPSKFLNFDIGPEGSTQSQILICKLGSHWLKFRPVGAELAIMRLLFLQHFCTLSGTFYGLNAWISEISLILMADCLPWGPLCVFSCVGIALPWSALWGSGHEIRELLRITYYLCMEVFLCCLNMSWGARGWPCVRDCPTVWLFWCPLSICHCYLKCNILSLMI